MTTPELTKKYYYVYCSYEDWPGGRSYIGRRGCDCLPEEDVDYFGSFTDKTFNPNKKIILLVVSTVQEVCRQESFFQKFFDVVPNPHYVNRSIQASDGFYYSHPTEDAKKYGKKGGQKSKELGLGFLGLPKEQLKEACRQAGKIGGLIGGKIYAELYSASYSFISPKGELVEGKNIDKFCRENDLDSRAIHKVINGERRHHKGWILSTRPNLILIGDLYEQ